MAGTTGRVDEPLLLRICQGRCISFGATTLEYAGASGGQPKFGHTTQRIRLSSQKGWRRRTRQTSLCFSARLVAAQGPAVDRARDERKYEMHVAVIMIPHAFPHRANSLVLLLRRLRLFPLDCTANSDVLPHARASPLHGACRRVGLLRSRRDWFSMR